MRSIWAVAVLLALYFPAALYLERNDPVVRRDGWRPLHVVRSYAGPQRYAAAIWLPEGAARVAVMENGRRVAESLSMYDDPKKRWVVNGRRWKIIEFDLDHDPAGNSYHGLAVVSPDAISTLPPSRDAGARN